MAVVVKRILHCDRCGLEGEFEGSDPAKHWGKVHASDGFASIIGSGFVGQPVTDPNADWCPKCMGALRAFLERKPDA